MPGGGWHATQPARVSIISWILALQEAHTASMASTAKGSSIWMPMFSTPTSRKASTAMRPGDAQP